MPAAVAPATSTLLGSPRVEAMARKRQVEHRATDRITLDDKHIGALCRGPLGQLLGGVDPQRRLIDPRVVDHVGELAQLVETRTAQRSRHQGPKSGHDCSCWRTVTPVSAKGPITIGIDIGTTAVKAVAADEDGHVVARTRIPHQLLVPAPDLFEHDADEAWRRGPLAALAELGRPDAVAVAVTAMVPSLTAVDNEGGPLTPGLLYGDGRGRGPAGADTTFLSGETVEFLRWTAREAPDAAGYWPATAVANHALAGEAVIDNATASTTYPLFDGTGWSEAACAECGATAERMPRVEPTGRRGRSGARYRRRAGRRFGRRPVRAAGRGCRPGRRRGRALRHDPHRVDDDSGIPGSARAVDRAAHHRGKVSDRRAEQRRWPVPQLGESPLWPKITRRSIPGGCRCGRRTFAASGRRTSTRIGGRCSTGLTSHTAAPRCGGRRYEASGFVVRQLIEMSGASAVAHRGDRRWDPRAAVDAGDRRCHRSARRRVGRAGGGGAWGPRSSAGWRQAWKRQWPTRPDGRRRNASSNPTLRGPTRSRIATPDS